MDNNSKDKNSSPQNTPEVGKTEVIFEKKLPQNENQLTMKTESGSTKPAFNIDEADETIIYDISKVRKAQEDARAAQEKLQRPVSGQKLTPPQRQAPNKPIPRQSQPAPQNQPQPKPTATSTERRPDQTAAVPMQTQAVNVPAQTAPEKKASKKKKSKEPTTEGGAATTVLSVVWAVLYIVFVIVTSVFLGFGIIFAGNDVFAFVKEDMTIEVVIPEYATLNEVADIFYEEGLIQYKGIFKMWSQLRDKDDAAEFVAGTHTVSPSMNYDELRAAIRPILKREIVRITIPEGFTTDEIIDLFVEKGISTREKFVEAINNYDYKEAGYDYWFLDELTENGISSDRFYRLDGYLFPDTYDFYSTSSAASIVAKFLDNFSFKFNETFRARTAELNMTVDELINLAALVEKEAKFIVDFANISSVFHNRLKNKASFPNLQSDATTIYAIHHNTGTRPNTLTGADLSYESPYNSHLNSGMPPGPIANPGLEAIKYALYPDQTNYYFFVSSEEGNTYFAATNYEHEQNKNKVAIENNASQSQS